MFAMENRFFYLITFKSDFYVKQVFQGLDFPFAYAVSIGCKRS